MGLSLCKAVAYVDDLAFVVRDSKAIITFHEEKYNYKLKGTGSISYHLSCDFFRDNEDFLCIAPKKYIEKMNDGCKNMFNKKLSSNYKSPLEKGTILNNTQLSS